MGSQSPSAYLEALQREAVEYNGFNLICADISAAYYYSNRGAGIRKLEPGLFGLSNHLLDTPWPKVSVLKQAMDHLLNTGERVNPESALEILKNDAYPPETDLPDTGVGPIWEKLLSPVFIKSETYGTRSSSVILVDGTGIVDFFERSYPSPNAAGSDPADIPVTRHFNFIISQTRRKR